MPWLITNHCNCVCVGLPSILVKHPIRTKAVVPLAWYRPQCIAVVSQTPRWLYCFSFWGFWRGFRHGPWFIHFCNALLHHVNVLGSMYLLHEKLGWCQVEMPAASSKVGEKILPIMQASFSAHIAGCARCHLKHHGLCQTVSCGRCRILVVTFCVLLGFLHGAMALELGCFPQRDSKDQPEIDTYQREC